jgi:ADP-ribosylation factor-like protein 6|eukprot:gnl/Ergobibamus_cyprinoides/3819.p1 GENE.gnl/Ergobibamus_cyprinoides/3819~~gnl/Ergobibamus_cyprinoides/3819.p1  ORF type:complete len:182 (+),score=36.96 gnl/Ergobibamus_cyprinoides/3819:116-661(+)
MSLWARLLALFVRPKRKLFALVIGLDNAGKTSLVSRWCLAPVHNPPSTVGFASEKVNRDGVLVSFVDMSGHGRYRELWERHAAQADVVVFVLDTSDVCRLCVAADELRFFLASESLPATTPLLLIANKMDKPGALAVPDVVRALGIDQLCGSRRWQVRETNAVAGEGTDDAWSALISPSDI